MNEMTKEVFAISSRFESTEHRPAAHSTARDRWYQQPPILCLLLDNPSEVAIHLKRCAARPPWQKTSTRVQPNGD